MATCAPFDVNIEGDVAAAFANVKAQVEANGGTFNGDQNSGTISGNVPLMGSLRAEYTVTGSTVTVTVTQKPLLVPCSTIEVRVRDFFAAPV